MVRGDPLHGGAGRPVADEGLLVEPAYLCPADPSGQDRDMIEVRVAGHGRHRGVQVAGGELCRQVVIEHIRQPTVALCTRHGRPPIPAPAGICPGRRVQGGRRSQGLLCPPVPDLVDAGLFIGESLRVGTELAGIPLPVTKVCRVRAGDEPQLWTCLL